MAIAGYQGCEIGNKFPKDVHTLLHTLANHNLQVASQWFSAYFTEEGKFEKTVDDFVKHMEFLKAVGADVIVICECGHETKHLDRPIFNNKPIFTDAQWALLTKGLETVGRIARDNNMRLAYHYHMGTGIQDAHEVNKLMQNTDPNLVHLLLEIGHAGFTDVDPVKLAREYADRISHVHLKDIREDVLHKTKTQNFSFLEAVRQGVFTIPGDGCMDFNTIFSALKDANYEGWFIIEAEQDPAKAHPLTYAKRAREFILNMTSL